MASYEDQKGRPSASTEELTKEVQYIDKLSRHRALSLLLAGAVFGIIGFIFAATAGYWNIYVGQDLVSDLYENYPSGQAYYPITVSEMVFNPKDASGKAFLGFEALAAICLLTSWYPYQLSNVYIGERHTIFEQKANGKDKSVCCAACNFSWATLRQFLPSVGLFLVAFVSTTPPQFKTPSDFVTCQVHVIAATMLFGGYILVELQALFIAYPRGHVVMRRQERCIRIVFILICAVFASTTIILQFTYPYDWFPVDLKYKDKYVDYRKENLTQLLAGLNWINSNQPGPNPNATKLFMASVYVARNLETHNPVKVLADTASGWGLFCKLLTFWAEVIAGVFGLASHIVIWYFARERRLILSDYVEFQALYLPDADSDEELSDFDMETEMS